MRGLRSADRFAALLTVAMPCSWGSPHNRLCSSAHNDRPLWPLHLLVAVWRQGKGLRLSHPYTGLQILLTISAVAPLPHLLLCRHFRRPHLFALAAT